jgi:hypothetical protein
MKTLGQIAYQAYLDFSDGASLVTGQRLPEWEQTTSVIQHAWEHVAQEVKVAALERGPKPLPGEQ